MPNWANSQHLSGNSPWIIDSKARRTSCPNSAKAAACKLGGTVLAENVNLQKEAQFLKSKNAPWLSVIRPIADNTFSALTFRLRVCCVQYYCEPKGAPNNLKLPFLRNLRRDILGYRGCLLSRV
jgi:hypothetical protein